MLQVFRVMTGDVKTKEKLKIRTSEEGEADTLKEIMERIKTCRIEDKQCTKVSLCCL